MFQGTESTGIHNKILLDYFQYLIVIIGTHNIARHFWQSNF